MKPLCGHKTGNPIAARWNNKRHRLRWKPWSKKHGTEHTVGLARASKKMRVEYRVCPAEFGPQGASQ